MPCGSIYVVGVPATGKTTLIADLTQHLQCYEPVPAFVVIDEVARDLIDQAKIQPRMIQSGHETGMLLQQQILEAQAERERQIGNVMVLSDRSGIDPIVFATAYARFPLIATTLLQRPDWLFLRSRMQQSLVILCEPMPQWFVEDDVRVVPASPAETNKLHQIFCQLLNDQHIPFHVLPSAMERREERLQFVLHRWQRTTEERQDVRRCILGSNTLDEFNVTT